MNSNTGTAHSIDDSALEVEQLQGIRDWDLACFRGRHAYENMGEIPALFQRYEDVSGCKVDLAVVA
tara:strand:- start:1321 stop:1518 length:198 start_codon:yes stop_codon:yes gene_type:complete